MCHLNFYSSWNSRERARRVVLYDEYETYAATRGSSNNVILFNHHVVVNTYVCAFVEISMVVSYEVVTYGPDLAPRDDFRHEDLYE